MEHSHQHFHEMIAAKRDPVPDVTTQDGTVLSIVYVTAQPTFTGVIGGYSTMTGGAETTSQQSQFAAQPSTSQAPVQSQQSFSQAQPSASSPQSSAPFSNVFASQSSANSAFSSPVPTTLFTATSANNPDSGFTNTAIAGASTTSSSDSSTSSNSSGMSVGAKAGLAIGIIGVIGIIAAFLLWFLGKKKREQESYSRADDEKTTFGSNTRAKHSANHAGPTSPSANAPRLSLRPVSRMMAEFMGPPKNRTSHGNMLTVIGEHGPARNLTPSPVPPAPSPMERRLEQRMEQRPEQRPNPKNPFNDPQNPFADPEKPVSLPVERLSPPVKPVAPLRSAATPPQSPGITTGIVAGGTAAAAGAGIVAAARSAPINRFEDSNVEPTPREAPSPRKPVPGPAPDIAPGPVSDTPVVGNVYRVLIDFRPTMEDELELLSGQLVRLLHEYDDGWALCIRLDRSQQGVVPRTCLAAKPSKPKPSHLNQYARGPNPNGPPPPVRPGPNGRMSPAMGRPMSPAGGPAGRMNMTPPHSANAPAFNGPRMDMQQRPPRPMSPGGFNQPPRAMSPAGYNHPPRAMSPGGFNQPPRPMSPANGSPRRDMQQRPHPQQRPMSPGAFNQPPRPLSPGPRPQPKRSMSPGPYGAGGPPPMAGANQRRRSNSAGALNVRDRRNSPPGPSKLGPGPMNYRSQSPGIAM